MAKGYAKAFYKSAAWKKARSALIRDAHGLCQKCGEAGAIAHHITELTPANITEPMIALDQSNLMLLCHACHDAIHLGRACVDAELRFDDGGNLVRVMR